MRRTARHIAPHRAYHVTHRGWRRRPVFFADADRLRYLELFVACAAESGVAIWAWCLMRNHVHFILRGENPAALPATVAGAHGAYAQLVGTTRAGQQPLWAERFFASLLSDDHLWPAVRYVELNPVRARLVRSAEDYRWSSARAHASRSEDGVLSSGRPFPGGIADWSTWLAAGLHDDALARLRPAALTARPRVSRRLAPASSNPP